MTGRRRAGGAAAALAAAAALCAPPLASAHAILVGSSPADGSRLGGSPSEIRLRFNEAVSPRFRSVRLIAPGGHVVQGVRISTAGDRALRVEVPHLGGGTYAVSWRVLAEADGHTTSGTVVFGIGAGALPEPKSAREPLPSVVDVTLRWLRFSFLALLLGSLAVAFVVLRSVRVAGELRERASERVLRAAVLGGALAALVGVVSLVRESAALSSTLGRGWFSPGVLDELLFSSRWGRLWLCQEAAAVALTALAFACRRRGRAAPVAAALLAAALASAEALGSHAAALTDGNVAVGADALHVLAAAVWIGGVAALAIALWPVPGVGRQGSLSLAAACRRPFALLAGTSALLVVVTGLYSAGRQVASVDALLTTLYGRTLLAKTVLAAALAGIGLANFVLLNRLSHGGSVRRTVLITEARVGAAVLLAAGLLTASVPARGPQFAAPRPVHPPTLLGEAEDLLVSVTVRPNRPGDNVLTAVAASSRRPPPASIDRIDARLGPETVRLSRVGADRFFGTGRLTNPGTARMTLAVERGREALRLPFRWSVEPADPARAVTVSDRRLSSLVDPAALGLLAAAGLFAGIALLLQRFRLPLPAVREESP
jgi:copper transport protein